MRRSVPIALLERIARARNPRPLLAALLQQYASTPPPDGIDTYHPMPYQPHLWLRACDEVRCRVGPSLFAIRCADRQMARWPSGARKGAPKHLECVGCQLGSAYRARMPWHVPPKDSQPAEVMSAYQRAAKLQGKRERLDHDEAERIDPLAECSAMTPDDRLLP